MRPGLRLPLLLALLAIPAAFGRERPLVALCVLALDLALLALFLWERGRLRRAGGLSLRRELPPETSSGRTLDERLVLENRTPWRLRARLWDRLPFGLSPREQTALVALPPRGEVTSRRPVLVTGRGELRLTPPVAEVQSPLGLAVGPIPATSRSTLSSFPGLGAPGRAAALARQRRLVESGGAQARGRGEGTEVVGLRPAVAGDPFGSIDWKATARARRPIVRERRAERRQLVVLALDAGRRMAREIDGRSRLDLAVEAALSLGQATLQTDDRVGMVAFTDRLVRVLPPLRARRQLGLLSRALHDIEVELVEPPYAALAAQLQARFPRRALVVLFTDVAEPASARSLAVLSRFLGRRHLVLCVVFQDPSIARATAQPLTDVGALYRAGAAADLALERQRGLAELRRAGALVLEAPGATLATRTVDEYLRVKARGLL
ncbi:MAG: DUF58 domain-containing protein [Deltaproteobacteria bacterium]